MPKVSMSVAHDLGEDEALRRVQAIADGIKMKYADKFKDLQEEWSGSNGNFAFRTMGFNIKAGINVKDKAVDVNGDLPFAAMMFKGKIESGIREQLERLLS